MATDVTEDPTINRYTSWISGIPQFYEALSTNVKMTLIGVAVGMAVVITLLLTGGMTKTGTMPNQVPLVGGMMLTPAERNAAISAFQKNNLTEYGFDGTFIMVPRKSENQYMASLAENNALPGDFQRAYDEYIAQDNWAKSASERERLFHVAKLKQMSEIITSFSDVANASVEVTEPGPKGLRRFTPVSASVMISTVDGRAISAVRSKQIQNLVAHAFTNLSPDDVFVASDGIPGQGTGGGKGEVDTETAKAENEHLQNKKAYAETIEQEILRLFPDMEGIKVVANVEVSAKYDIITDADVFLKGAIKQQDAEDRSSDILSPGYPIGQPGVPPNVDIPSPNQGVATLPPYPRDLEEESRTQQDYNNDITKQQYKERKFFPETVGVVINIPKKYLPATGTGPLAGTWDSTKTLGMSTATPEFPTGQPVPMVDVVAIEAAILELGYPAMTQANIQLVSYTMKEPVPVFVPWWDRNGTMVIFGLIAAMATLGALWIATKSPVPDEARKALEEAIAAAAMREEGPLLPELAPREKFEQIRDAITDMIAAEPGATANLLHRWIITN